MTNASPPDPEKLLDVNKTLAIYLVASTVTGFILLLVFGNLKPVLVLGAAAVVGMGYTIWMIRRAFRYMVGFFGCQAKFMMFMPVMGLSIYLIGNFRLIPSYIALLLLVFVPLSLMAFDAWSRRSSEPASQTQTEPNGDPTS